MRRWPNSPLLIPSLVLVGLNPDLGVSDDGLAYVGCKRFPESCRITRCSSAIRDFCTFPGRPLAKILRYGRAHAEGRGGKYGFLSLSLLTKVTHDVNNNFRMLMQPARVVDSSSAPALSDYSCSWPGIASYFTSVLCRSSPSVECVSNKSHLLIVENRRSTSPGDD